MTDASVEVGAEGAAEAADAAGAAGAADAGAAARAAEEAAAFRHAHVPPDAVEAYGPHPDQVVDFYRPPAAAGPAPLVALLHGGAWRARYDRRHVSPFAAYLAANGFAVASVEYRRGSDGPAADAAGRWPETFDDVAAALDALPRTAVSALGAGAVDPRRIVLTGHSAGGHLALWAAARHLLPDGSPWRLASPPVLRGVVALAPLADLGAAVRDGVCGGAAAQLLGEAEGGVERGSERWKERFAQADPAGLVPTGVATTLVHGLLDEVVPARHSQEYAEGACAAGEEPTVTWLAATGHFPLIDPAAPAAAVVLAELAQLAF